MSMHVRIKPYDGKRRLIRSYTAFGIKFLESRGWYRVDDDVAEYLKTVTQRSEDPESGAAFDVCTAEEARALDIAEQKRKRSQENRRLPADEAMAPDRRVHTPGRGTMTTDDLPRPSAKKAESFDDMPDTFDDKDMAGPRQHIETLPEDGEEAPDAPEPEPVAPPPPAPKPAAPARSGGRRR